MEIKTEKQTKEVKVYVKTTDEYAYSIWFTNDFDKIYSSKEECRLNKEICKDDFFFHCFKNGEYVKSVDGDCGFACPKREMSKFDTIIEHGPDCDMVYLKNFNDSEIEKYLSDLGSEYCLESDLNKDVQELKLKSSGELEPEDIIDAYAKLEEVELESNGELGSIEVVETIKEYILVKKTEENSQYTHYLINEDDVDVCTAEDLGLNESNYVTDEFGDEVIYPYNSMSWWDGSNVRIESIDNNLDYELRSYNDEDFTKKIVKKIEESTFETFEEYGCQIIDKCEFEIDGKKIKCFKENRYNFFDYALIIEEA